MRKLLTLILITCFTNISFSQKDTFEVGKWYKLQNCDFCYRKCSEKFAKDGVVPNMVYSESITHKIYSSQPGSCTYKNFYNETRTVLLTDITEIQMFLPDGHVDKIKNGIGIRNFSDTEINLRFKNIDKFGKQHRTGNHLIIAGTLLNGLGLLFISNSFSTTNQNYSKLNDSNLGTGFMIAGSLLTTTGLVINLDSFRHLRK